MRWRYFFSSPHHCGEGDCRRRRSEGEESAFDLRGVKSQSRLLSWARARYV